MRDGLMDLVGYDKFLSGQLNEYHLPEEELTKSLEAIKDLPKVGVIPVIVSPRQ